MLSHMLHPPTCSHTDSTISSRGTQDHSGHFTIALGLLLAEVPELEGGVDTEDGVWPGGFMTPRRLSLGMLWLPWGKTSHQPPSWRTSEAVLSVSLR